MKQKLDIETWNRREHFNFFRKFEEPFYGVCVKVDCTAAYRSAKAQGVSFFLYTMYNALAASLMVEPFKYRAVGDEVFIYDRIDAGSTFGRPNGTFGYGHVLYYPSITEFITEANKEVERVKNTTDLTRTTAENIMLFSSLPWIDFTSVSHARMFSVSNSCPRVSFGKITEDHGRKFMPVSIHVHHALVDGLHVGQYIDCFQQLLNQEA